MKTKSSNCTNSLAVAAELSVLINMCRGLDLQLDTALERMVEAGTRFEGVGKLCDASTCYSSSVTVPAAARAFAGALKAYGNLLAFIEGNYAAISEWFSVNGSKREALDACSFFASLHSAAPVHADAVIPHGDLPKRRLQESDISYNSRAGSEIVSWWETAVRARMRLLSEDAAPVKRIDERINDMLRWDHTMLIL